MKSLAFFCSIGLLAVAGRAEVSVGAPGSSTSNAAASLNWSAAIQKFAKDGADGTPDSAESKLLEQHLSSDEPSNNLTAAPAPARGASAAAKGAPTAAGATNAAIAAAGTSTTKKDESEDIAGQIRHSVWDIVKPYQELLPGSSVETRPPSEDGAGGSGQVQPGGQRYAPKSESQKRVEKIRSDILLEQLLDELKPWAFGALGIGLLAFALGQWMAYMKRKPSVNPNHTTSRTSSHTSSRRRRKRAP